METQTPEREAAIDELNALTEQKWDLMDQIAEVEVARTALFKRLRELEYGTQVTSVTCPSRPS